MLQGKVVVITGGGGLIGRQIARAVASNGGIAVIGELNADAGNRAAEEVRSGTGGSADFVPLDITSACSIDAMIEQVSRRHGRIDAVVNNAYPRNRAYGAKFEDVTYDDFCGNVDMHLGGYFLVCQRISRHFVAQGHGNVVNVASIYGVVAPRFEVYDDTPMTMPVEYAVVKSGLIHLTKYMAAYFKGSGIRFNCISPGGILDGQPASFVGAYRKHALSKGMLDPGDLAGAFVFLLSDASAFVNGHNLVVDDGWSL